VPRLAFLREGFFASAHVSILGTARQGQLDLAAAARLATATIVAYRGEIEDAERLAAAGERALLSSVANPQLAMVQWARGAAALAAGRYDGAHRGYFGGTWGGRFMPEALVAALDELTDAWREAMADEAFVAEFERVLRDYAGTPSRLYHAERLSDLVGARVLLKREDLNHTGAHKIRNVLGQALLTKRMGKTRVIAETGAGQHGVASATAAAWFDLDCTDYMGAVDTRRQALDPRVIGNVGRAGDVAHSNGALYEVDVFPKDATPWRLEVEVPSRPVTTAERDSALAAVIRAFRVPTANELPPPVREAYQNPRPHHPPLSVLKVLRDGTLWIRPTPEAGASTARWDVFARDGKRLGAATLPNAARVRGRAR